jgi:hypothetical protein
MMRKRQASFKPYLESLEERCCPSGGRGGGGGTSSYSVIDLGTLGGTSSVAEDGERR